MKEQGTMTSPFRGRLYSLSRLWFDCADICNQFYTPCKEALDDPPSAPDELEEQVNDYIHEYMLVAYARQHGCDGGGVVATGIMMDAFCAQWNHGDWRKSDKLIKPFKCPLKE